MSLHQSENLMTSRTVGQAIHELALTEALSKASARLLPPGNGRSVIVIPEVAIGRGRPDILVIVVSVASLHSYLASGLQVQTLREARALVTDPIRSSPVKGAGRTWTESDIKRFSKSVFDSLAVEAKMKDWKQAIRQASRFRHLAHRAAIMLPDDSVLGRAEPYLRTYDLGFIGLAKRRPFWFLSAGKTQLHPGHALWLLELAARQSRTR
jgi:hypothetical protein